MPEESELESATNLAMIATWVAIAVAFAYLLGMVLSWSLLRVGRRSELVKDIARSSRRPFRVTLMVIAANITLQRTSDPEESWRGWLDHTLLIVLIAAVTWLVASLAPVAERRATDRFAGGDTGLTDADRQWRRIRTQVTVMRRLAVAITVVLGIAAALMTFPSFSDIGTTLFASAGVLSVVAGLAAQTSLGAVFAGMQIAFSDAVRVGDIVVLEDEWGRIEEITLTYVVVRLWDERRLVLPCTYFTTTPFQNWTRNATEIMGTAELDVDFSVPLDAMRVELQRLLSESDLWDGRTGVLQVTDAVGGVMRVRILVSAPNAGALWDLRCEVREGIVEWLQQHAAGGLPRWRVELSSGHVRGASEPAASRHGRADATLFSGSEEGEERGRAFEGPESEGEDRTHADELAGAYGRNGE